VIAYRRVLVPVCDNGESERAMDMACRLANARAAIVCVAVVEVPALLPLDAHMQDEEEHARAALGRARAIAEKYGVSCTTRLLRSRQAADSVVAEAEARHVELIVIAATRRQSRRGPAALGRTVEHVLRHATCRVLVIEELQAAA
jgi:nucleotide-binding universal stress UspA family protein